MNKREFLQGRTRIPVPLRADAYTIAGQAFAGEDAKCKSIYNFTTRYSPRTSFGDVAHDDRMILFGIVQYIRNQLTDPCTPMDVVKAREFMETAHSLTIVSVYITTRAISVESLRVTERIIQMFTHVG